MPPTSMNSHRRLAVVAVAGIVALSSCALGSTADEPTDALDDPTPVARETLSTLPALPDSGSDAAHGSTDTVAGAPMEHHDHAPGRDLVDPARATHTAITDGSWSNPATWTNNAVPGEGSRVTIPAGTVVTIDSVLAPAIKTVGVDGTLRFASDRDTQLRVDTLVSAPTGTLEIGTAERPVEPAVTATVQFADDGPIDRTWDPTLLSRGAILAGTTMVHGAETTHRSTVDSFPRTGDTTISLSAAPTGWRVDDEIVITGTDGPTSDEVRRIRDLDGPTIELDRPLDTDHVPPASDLDLYVANLTRNVRFTSENAELDRRGHLMIAHTLNAHISGAQFIEMGRTDKSRELDDVEFIDIEPGAVDWSGEYEALGGTNIRGRYSVHVHRGGADPASTPAVIADSVVTGDPGWAYTNHSSHVDFLRNVAYNNAGAGFFTEAGDEVGRWIDNIAIRSVMANFTLGDEGAIDPDVRADRQDFGIDGDGFWLQGNRVDLIGNVAAGATAHGIIWWSEGLAEADLGSVSSVEVATLPEPGLIPGRRTIPVWWSPMGEVRDNVAYGATIGFRSRYVHGATYLEDPDVPPLAYVETLQPVIDGMTTWDVRDGVLMNYNERLTLRNIRAIGRGTPFRHNYGATAAIGVGIDVGNDATFGPGAIEQADVRGFEVGLIGPRHGAWRIDDIAVAATTDVLLHSPEHTERNLAISNLRQLPLTGTALSDRDEQRRHIVLAYDYAGDGDGVDPSTADDTFVRDRRALLGDRVTVDGRGVYSLAQHPDAAPIDDGLGGGMSNRDLFARSGTAPGGTLLPADAALDPRIVNGAIGAPAASPTLTHSPGRGGFLEFESDEDEFEADDESDDDEALHDDDD